MSSLIGELKLNAFISKIEFAKKNTVMKATEFVRYKAKMVLKAAAMASPQWSGNFTAHWHLYTNAFPATGTTTKFKVNPWEKLIDETPGPRQMGDMEAVNWVLQNEQEVIDSLKWNTKIKLVNSHPLSEAIEAGQMGKVGNIQLNGHYQGENDFHSGLRPVNKLPGDLGVIAYLKSKPQFSYLR